MKGMVLLTLINYNTKTHREVFGKQLTVEDISKIGYTYYLFDKTEYVYVGRGFAYNPEAGEKSVALIYENFKNVRKNNEIIAKRKEKGRKLVAVRFVRKKKRKTVKA